MVHKNPVELQDVRTANYPYSEVHQFGPQAHNNHYRSGASLGFPLTCHSFLHGLAGCQQLASVPTKADIPFLHSGTGAGAGAGADFLGLHVRKLGLL